MHKTKDLQHIKRENGIYFLLNDKEIVYIGRSKNVYCRVLEHIIDNLKDFDNVIALYNDNILSTEITEVILISREKPKYNKLVVDEDLFLRTIPKSIFKENTDDFKIIASEAMHIAKRKIDEI